MTVEQSISKALLNGAVEVSKFNGAVRTDDINTFEEGDVFTIPQDYKILESKVGQSDRKAQYIVVDVNGTPKNFYPSSLTKNLGIVDDECRPTGARAKTSGSVCEWFKTQVGVDEAMKKLKGCTLKVSKITPYQVKRFGTVADIQTTGFMTVDFEGTVRPQ